MSVARTICTQFLGVLCWPCYVFAVCVCPTYVEEDPESGPTYRVGRRLAPKTGQIVPFST